MPLRIALGWLERSYSTVLFVYDGMVAIGDRYNVARVATKAFLPKQLYTLNNLTQHVTPTPTMKYTRFDILEDSAAYPYSRCTFLCDLTPS